MTNSIYPYHDIRRFDFDNWSKYTKTVYINSHIGFIDKTSSSHSLFNGLVNQMSHSIVKQGAFKIRVKVSKYIRDNE